MLNREDKNSEKIVKIGIDLASRNEVISARQFMTGAGIPHAVIERVLYEPSKIRKSDWNSSV